MKQEDFDKILETNGGKNLGWRADRLDYDPKDIENALSKHWREENKKKVYLNHGQGVLQDLFIHRTGSPFCITAGSIRFLKISKRDRLIAATVIQWLGSNIGFCWLQEALSKAGYDITKRKS